MFKHVKKTLSLLLAVLMIVSLATCGGSPANNAQDPDSSSQTPDSTPTEAKYKVVAASAGTSGDCLEMVYKIFKEKIEAETNGEIAVEIFMDSQLGAMSDYIGGLQMNTIQICDVASTTLSSTTDEFMIFDLPYLVASADQELKFFNDSIGEELSAAMYEDTGLTVGGYIVRNPRNVYSSKGPINTPEDFKGLKIRTMDAPPLIRAMELLGATATPIATNERYLALQTGVVDAAENNVGEIYIKKEYEVTSYLSKTEHLIQPNVVLLSATFLDSLPDNYRELVLQTVKDACYEASEYELGNAETYETALAEEGGMTVNEVSAENKARFKETMVPLYDEYRDVIGGELIDKVINYQ